MCVYTYIFIFDHICVYIYIYIHLIIYVYIHIYIYTFDHICVYIYVYLHLIIYVWIYIYIYIWSWMCVCVYIYIHLIIYVCTYIHVYIYIYIYIYYKSHMNEIYRCDMTHSYVRHDSFICVIWLIHMGDVTLSNPYEFICETELIQYRNESFHMAICHFTYASHILDSFISETWLVQIRFSTASVNHELVTQGIGHGTHINGRVTHMNESWHTFKWVMSHIWMRHGTHMNKSWDTFEWVMAHI